MTSSAAASFAGKIFRRPEFFLALLVSLLIGGFHFYLFVHASGFWRDEVNLINVAARPSLSGMAKDSFPLLMPLLVKGWKVIGLAQSDYSLRLLGTFIGLAAIGGLWLASWTARRSPPSISLVLFGFNSTVIAFGDSLRGYGLGSLTILLTFSAACFFLQRPDWRRAVLFAVSAVFSVQSLYHNVPLVAAISMGAATVCLRRKNWPAIAQIGGVIFITALSLAPYAGNFIFGTGVSNVLRSGASWSVFTENLMEAFSSPWPPFRFVWLTAAVLIITISGICFLRKQFPEASAEIWPAEDLQLFVFLTFLTAIVGFLAFLWFAALRNQAFYFIPLMALVAACLDAQCATLPRRVKMFLSIAALFMLIISLPVEQRALNFRFTNVDIWTTELKADASPDDFIIVTPWFCGISFDHYYQGATPWVTLPPMADHSTHRYDLLHAQMLTTNAIAPVLEQMTATLRNGHRVWFLCPADLADAFKEGVPKLPTLPPPPLPDSGWSPDPYVAMWTTQTFAYLTQHARQAHQVNSPATEKHIAENLNLIVFEGWQSAP